MSQILMPVFGSLGDLHPFVALALELRERGHAVRFATLPYYREKMDALGFPLAPMRPNLSPDDPRLAEDLMDAKRGTERILREVLFPVLGESYADLSAAVEGCDAMVASEVAFAAPLVSEKTGVPWISTALSPGGFFSAHDPFVPPNMTWFGNLRFLGVGFHQALRKYVLDRMIEPWGEPVRALRRELGLRADVEPILRDKYSPLLNLALFSRVLGTVQPDWHQPTVQTGFCFYDGQRDLGKMPDGLSEFLDAGEPPIVFTLGSAAVWAAGNFFKESAEAAKRLRRRAILIMGENELPADLLPEILAVDYAPYSLVFPRAAAVVHQAGIGTTGQVLRAGVPHLIMPFSHDQPDNAARCVRLGVARTVKRENYNAVRAAENLRELLSNPAYRERAAAAKRIVDSENGVKSACDEIERILSDKK